MASRKRKTAPSSPSPPDFRRCQTGDNNPSIVYPRASRSSISTPPSTPFQLPPPSSPDRPLLQSIFLPSLQRYDHQTIIDFLLDLKVFATVLQISAEKVLESVEKFREELPERIRKATAEQRTTIAEPLREKQIIDCLMRGTERSLQAVEAVVVTVEEAVLLASEQKGEYGAKTFVCGVGALLTACRKTMAKASAAEVAASHAAGWALGAFYYMAYVYGISCVEWWVTTRIESVGSQVQEIYTRTKDLVHALRRIARLDRAGLALAQRPAQPPDRGPDRAAEPDAMPNGRERLPGRDNQPETDETRCSTARGPTVGAEAPASGTNRRGNSADVLEDGGANAVGSRHKVCDRCPEVPDSSAKIRGHRTARMSCGVRSKAPSGGIKASGSGGVKASGGDANASGRDSPSDENSEDAHVLRNVNPVVFLQRFDLATLIQTYVSASNDAQAPDHVSETVLNDNQTSLIPPISVGTLDPFLTQEQIQVQIKEKASNKFHKKFKAEAKTKARSNVVIAEETQAKPNAYAKVSNLEVAPTMSPNSEPATAMIRVLEHERNVFVPHTQNYENPPAFTQYHRPMNENRERPSYTATTQGPALHLEPGLWTRPRRSTAGKRKTPRFE